MNRFALAIRGRRCRALTFFCLVLFLGLSFSPQVALADGGIFGDGSTEVEHDTAGNLVAASDSVSVTQDVERDAILAGRDVTVAEAAVGGDILAAGQTADISKSQVNGDIRAAGNTVHVAETQLDGNFTAAGSFVDFDAGSHAAAVYATGSYVDFEGSASYAALVGQQVFIDGEVDGDVVVSASSVRIGENAAITGKLTVVGAQPDVADGAQIASMDVQLAEASSAPQRLFDSLIGAIVLLTMIVTIAAIWWLAPDAAQDSLFMFQARRAPMLLTGVVALIAVPFAVAALLASGIGMILAVVLVCAAVLLAILGLPFMCAAIARRVMRGSREWAVVGMAAAIAGLILSLPAINVVGVLCGGVYIAGYVLQRLFLKLQARSAMRQGQLS